ncbi:MAG: FAD-binding oxidoreductase [Planktomarina sp.]
MTQSSFFTSLRQALPGSAFPDLTPNYLQEPRGKWQGQAAIFAAPDRVQDVAAVVRLANTHGVPVVPYGGGTGLVGGQVKPDGMPPVVLSLHRMNRVRGIWPDENSISVDGGCILANVQAAAQDVHRLFPLSLASEGTAQIGGLLATNAGGVNVLRYGNARDLVLGLECVLPDGGIWNGMTRLRKDNMGYDLRHLMIGSEGTLGVITGATLKLHPVPAHPGTALMVVNDPACALTLLGHAQACLGDVISAFELISGQGLKFLRQTMPGVRLPFTDDPEWMVLIDIGLDREGDPQALLETIYEIGLAQNLVGGGLIAQSQSQAQEFWSVRESIPLANRAIGALASHDVSLPLSHISDFITRATDDLMQLGHIRVNCFGHLGDGNLHFNAFPEQGHTRDAMVSANPDLITRITQTIHDRVDDMGGSISAEHGVGRLKVDDLHRYGDPVKLAAMRAIKTALDPKGIMNPGAVLEDL